MLVNSKKNLKSWTSSLAQVKDEISKKSQHGSDSIEDVRDRSYANRM